MGRVTVFAALYSLRDRSSSIDIQIVMYTIPSFPEANQRWVSGKTGICLWFIWLDHLTWQTTCECFCMINMLGFHIGGHWNIWISSTMIANTYNNNFFFHVIQSIRNKIIILTRISLIRHINLILDKYFRQVPTTRKLDYYYYYANIEG